MSETNMNEQKKSVLKITEIKYDNYDDLYIGIKNKSDKTIKYVRFTVVPKNAVQDIVGEEEHISATGPLKPNEHCSFKWQLLWLEAQIKSVCIQNAEIEYMDGTMENLNAEELNCTTGDSKENSLNPQLVKGIIGLVILVIIMIIYYSSGGDSSSYKKNSTYNSYDRYYSNDEISDFVNNYNGKW